MDDKFNSQDVINLIPLDSKTNELAENILNETDIDKVKDLTHLFNLNQAKKNVLRILKLNSLLDKVSDQMIERFEKRPGEFSNADLLNYMQVTQNAIDRANKALNLVDETPAIQINQVVINDNDTLDRESRTKIRDAVNAILQKSKQLELDKQIDYIEVPVVDTNETVSNNTVEPTYNILNEEDE